MTNYFKTALLGLIVVLFSACSNGDKKSIIGADFGDTSFVNKNYAGNKKDFKDIGSPCDLLRTDQIAKIYGVPVEKVKLDRPNEVGNSKSCRFLVFMSEEEFDYLTGFIAVESEVAPSDDPGGIAQATGGGTDWVEAWELRKTLSKSSEYLPNMGKAAIWFNAKRNLLIKLDGYSLSITAPGAAFNTKEQEKKRDYKAVAVEIAKSSGLF